MTPSEHAAESSASPATADVPGGLLSEKASREILAAFRIPFVPQKIAKTPEEAASLARDMGFPVVIKGYGTAIAHKTEIGLVKTGLTSTGAVTKAARAIEAAAPQRLEGILIQPMITGRREFVAGIFRDPLFGPVILFGLGGIFTEVLKDIILRLAPLSDTDMEEMITGIAARKLLGPFRGESAVSEQQIKQVLGALSQVAMAHPEIHEVDINPLIATAGGDLFAVDALVKTGDIQPAEPSRPAVKAKRLKSLFFPDSVAFIGASKSLGKWGNMLPANTISGHFPGSIHLVNPRGGTLFGHEIHRSVSEIDGPVDLAVVTLPAALVKGLIPQLEQKKIPGMLLITSGFSETGAAGKQLEKELIQAAARAGITVLGPNTMGICSPHRHFYCSSSHAHPIPGGTALVSQSGNLGVQLLTFAEQQGIGMRLYSGSGNEAMVTVEDHLDFFERDEKTRAVVLYIESVKNGRRFFESAARMSRQKPIILLKGGRTDTGARAAASHSGAMASDDAVFQAACHQAGILQVRQSVEMLDFSAVFSALPLPRGNRIGIVTLGGGWGVVTADHCQENNLVIPDLPSDIIAALDARLPDYWSRSNPIDIVGEYDIETPLAAIEALLKWDGCDAVLHLGIDGKRIFGSKMLDSVAASDPDFDHSQLDAMKAVTSGYDDAFLKRLKALVHAYEKPVIGVSFITDGQSKLVHGNGEDQYRSVLFPSPDRAVRALAGMCQQGRRQDSTL